MTEQILQSDNQGKNDLLNTGNGKTTSETQQGNGQIHSSSLTASQFNILSHNLSELADRISPAKCEHDPTFFAPQTEVGDGNFKLRDDNLANKHANMEERPRAFSDSTSKEWDSCSSHSKLPYSRKGSYKMKNYVSKQKSFLRKQTVSDQRETFSGFESSSQETESDFSQKHDSEDSGYSSSRSTFSREKKSGEHDELCDKESNAAAKTVSSGKDKMVTHGDNSDAALSRTISDVEKRLNSLILGKNHSVGDGKFDKKECEDSANASKESDRSGDCTSERPCTNSEAKAVSESRQINPGEFSGADSKTIVEVRNTPAGIYNNNKGDADADVDQGLGKSPFHLQKGRIIMSSVDDSAVAKGRPRPNLVRRRTTLLSFRRPRQMAAQEGETDTLEIDEATYTQCFGDIKNLKTMLLKLKRELQEVCISSV